MIVLFTDFGIQDPYVGQLKSVLLQHDPGVAIIDLLHHVPAYNIRAAAYLLPAYVDEFPHGSVFLCVIDPGVGGERIPCVAEIDGRWFVGPDNGLFAVMQRRAQYAQWWKITAALGDLPPTFHGRDVFAPVAARLARGDMSGLQHIEAPSPNNWPADLAEIVYIDHYGNLVSGYRYNMLPDPVTVSLHDSILTHARTFCVVEPGQAFYYKNSNGLLEIAVNQGNACRQLHASVGDALEINAV